MPAPKKAPKDQTKPERPQTKYVILRLTDAEDAWTELGEIGGHSDVGAIRSWLDRPETEVPDERQTYIAVPVRSFKSHVVDREIQTKLHIT